MPERKPKPPETNHVGIGIGAAVVAVLAAIFGGIWSTHTPPAASDPLARYESQMADIHDPKDARTKEELDWTLDHLQRLTVPDELQVRWSKSDAGKRHGEWLADAKALDHAAHDITKGWNLLVEEGAKVLRNKDAPNLPRRAKEVLDKSEELVSLTRNKDQLLPGSKRLTYGTVVQIADVKNAEQEWHVVRAKLVPLAALEKP